MSNNNGFLDIAAVAERLNVSEETLYRWVDHDRFPCSFENGRMRFSEQEIDEWMNLHRETARRRMVAASEAGQAGARSLFDLISRGGIVYNVEGDLPAQVIANSIQQMHLPDGCDRQILTGQMQEREKVISTAIGNGIAVPHARTPVLNDEADERVGLIFLRGQVDFHALDRVPVSVLFVMLSARRRTHLQILQRIGYFVSQEEFLALLRRRAPREEIFCYLDSHRLIMD